MTEFADPAVLPEGIGQKVNWSPNGNEIVVGTFGIPNVVSAYEWQAGFGTRFADPVVPIDGTVSGIVFSKR